MSTQDTPVERLEFRTVEGADLDTQLLILAFLEHTDLPMTSERLNLRVPVVPRINIAPIMHSLKHSGWVNIEKFSIIQAEPEAHPTEYYSLTDAGVVTATQMLTPKKNFFFGILAHLLGFNLEIMLPDPEPNKGAESAMLDAMRSFSES